MIASGVDIIAVDRVARAVERSDTFRNRVFTAQEQAYCDGNAERYAGRWAVKEAVAKALGTGVGDVTWLEIEVVCDERGKPELQLSGAAAVLSAEKNLYHWSISIAHDNGMAIGFAVATDH